jgi:ATP-dependent Clp protease protease subunit
MAKKPKEKTKKATGLIWILDKIDKDTLVKFISEFVQLENDPEVGNIMVKINSPGGQVSCGIAIAEEIRLSSKPVITVAQGTVASIAVSIFEAGHVRQMTRLSEIMLHKPSSMLETAGYSAEELKSLWKKNLATERMMLKLLSEKTGKSMGKIKRDIGTLKTLTADEAVAYGLADKII